ncbi:DUF3891 family protein [Anditalea andensis]|uniref:DUF3891 domain-containing protein n=1 Tax=Anditalea andensis TaxID=1048983 RepID=A0A074KTZ0_9BACT|nr:DUF3891 family protein [Anditalea andensis]KEO71720.1 hypothetical protein EL17_21275 [Anditalea andensis]
MIVNIADDHFEIIYQRAHGMLAAKIAEQIAASLRPPASYWLETLVAIADHDDGRRNWEGDFHINDKGYPKDFTEFKFDEKQAQRVVNTAECKSIWVAMLVSKHLVELYSNLEEAQPLIQQQYSLQAKLQMHLPFSEAAAQMYYRLLKWADELSLRICKHEVPVKGEKDFLEYLPDGSKSYITHLEDKSIAPWIFQKDKVIFEVEKRLIEKRVYKNDHDLQDTLNKAEVSISSYKFIKEDA